MTSTSGIHSFLPSLPILSTTSSPKSSLQAAAFLLFNDFRPGGVKPPIEALYCSNVIDIFGHQGHSKKVELLSQNCQSSFNNHWSQRLISCCNHYVFANTDLFTDLRKVVQIQHYLQGPSIAYSWTEAKIFNMDQVTTCHGIFQALEISRSW